MKKSIEWGTPKRIQKEIEKPPRTFKVAKKFRGCKFNKSGHDFEWEEWEAYRWTKGEFRSGKCKFCGKKEYQHR